MYDFSTYKPFMDQLRDDKINPLVILDYQNPLYDGGATPYSDAAYAAWVNYVKAVLNYFGSRISYVEVWNEPNGGWFDDHGGACVDVVGGHATRQKPTCYAHLLQVTYQAVKSIRPDVGVVGGVLYQVDTNYLEQVFQAGGMPYMDIISDHPYGATPEDGTADTQQIGMENLIKQYNNGNPKPIWATEVGWESSVVGYQNQADYLVRSAVLSLAAGVQKYFWYDFMNDHDEYGGIHTHGLFDEENSAGQYPPKPSATAYKVLTQQVGTKSFVRSEIVGSGIYDKLFSNDLRVVWSTAGNQQIYVQTANQLTVTSMTGATQTVTPVNGVATLTASADPIYIQGAASRVLAAGSGGTVTGMETQAPASTVNLSAEGRSDWATWAAATATSYDRKSTGGSQISNYTLLGTGSASKSGGGAPTVSWSDGTPDAGGTNTAGAYTAGANNGFQLTVPADTTKRAVKLYVNSWHATGQLVATLSDGSGSYLDTSVSSSSGTSAGVYTLIYQANSANQTLTLKWTTSTDFGGGGVVLEAATLGPAFSTGVEPNDLAPTWNSAVDNAAYPAGGLVNVTGVCCGMTAPEAYVDNGAPLSNHSGTQSLLYSGSGTTSSGADHAYLKVFDLSGKNLVVGPGTTLTYWIDPESSANSYGYASGGNSTCVAVDLIFTDNTNLRDSGAVDQNGNRAHPSYQCGHLTLDTWNRVTVNLGAVANGKTISRVDIGYDQANVTGGYRGHIDDISVID
ncbi:hypothetical protein GCM10009839_13390 [Catenulispora yoronensis]|uniref:Asl1-like glycosyl hydrolase catalytic domain-containing protein n=2 Tax=Catenulispora yoronensis TaxID=450799 RepID=A0ABP5F6H3_9ACTN